MKETFLLEPREGEHRLYTRLRDPRAEELLDYFLRLWSQFSDSAPKGFRKKLQIEFYQRWWEMSLFVGLARLGLSPECPRSDQGPDIFLSLDSSDVFIEATAPNVGNNPDVVPEFVLNSVSKLPERQCLLRLTQGLTVKRKCIDNYLSKETIHKRASCVIAISSGGLNQFGSLLDAAHPAMLSVLAGAGHTVISMDGRRPPFSKHRPVFQKASGNDVDACLFDSDDFRNISAVLYSNEDPWNGKDEPERSFQLFLNPNATRPLPGRLSDLMETWAREIHSNGEVEWEKTKPTQ